MSFMNGHSGPLPATQRLWPSNALHAAIQSWRSAPPWSCLPRAMTAGSLFKTSSVPGTAFTRVALYWESRRAVSPDRTAHVIDSLKRPGAQTGTLCGKLEREKARQPQVRKVSTGHRVRGRHRPFQKVRGLDQEIFRKAFLRPYLQLHLSMDRSRPLRLPTMILRPCLSLPDSGFLWEEGT